MDPSPANHRSVARRLALLSLAGLAAVLLTVSIGIGVIEQRNTHALMVSAVTDRVQSVVAVADASDQINLELTRRNFESFRQEFDPTPSWNEASGEILSFGSVINNDFTNLEIGLNARTFEPTLRLVLRIFDDAMSARIRDTTPAQLPLR